MHSLPRNFLALAIILSVFSPTAFADLKIKTRTTVMGHSSESTVYIKGARERRDMSFGGRGGGAVSITQCDQKRMITITGDRCMVMAMGGGETSCPDMSAMGKMGRNMDSAEPTAPHKGGVITITRNSTDTGERQEMMGYKARHIKTSMVMESSPDACNQSHMKMETDGWYADLSASFSCGDDVRSLACGMGRQGERCHDRIVVKGGGSGSLGYPLKQTTTMSTDQGTFATTTEVLEITTATLDAPLFEMPPGCKVMDMSAMMGGAPTMATEMAPAPSTTPAKAESPAPAKAAASAAPAVAPKSAGVVRVGVVKLKDISGQSLPTDSLRLNLMSEIGRHQLEAVPLDAESPQQDVESEARAKECDYILYTTPNQVKDPGTGGLPAGSVPKGVVLDPAKYQALTAVTLYKIGKPVPEIKDLPLAADGGQFAVNAVMATFALESDKVAQQVDDDAHPKAPPKTSKVPAKAPAKPK
ncbi:MAG: hypothetical protein P4M04_11365 [Acidobacteriota bacterium]|nr:hypothetical protein [Acidobacteriota bacterium]